MAYDNRQKLFFFMQNNALWIYLKYRDTELLK